MPKIIEKFSQLADENGHHHDMFFYLDAKECPRKFFRVRGIFEPIERVRGLFLVIIQRNAHYESGEDIYIPLLIARSFYFLQLFFYDIILCNSYFTSYLSLKYKSILYTTVRSDATALSKHLRATEILTLFFSSFPYISTLVLVVY